MSTPTTRIPKIAPVSLRTELKRVTRERLVSTAMHLFETEGFKATTVAQIVQEAGTTAPTFYRYFKGKSDLMWLVNQQLVVRVTETMLLLDQMGSATRASVANWVNQYAAMWRQVHRLCDAYWEATTTDPELAAESVPTTFKLTSLMKNTLGDVSPKLRPKLQARLVIVILLMDKFMYVLESTGGTPNYQLLLDEFSEMLWILLFDRKK